MADGAADIVLGAEGFLRRSRLAMAEVDPGVVVPALGGADGGGGVPGADGVGDVGGLDKDWAI